MLSNDALLAQFQKHRQSDEADLSSQHTSAREDHEFTAGDAMYYSATVEDKGQRKAVVFNKVKPYVDAVVGMMIQMRRKPDYQARVEDSAEQQAYSAYTNSFSDYAREGANLSFLETWQDREMMIAGYGAIDTNVGYEKNPDGEVVAEVCRFDDIFWDGQAKEPNLLDARWVRRKKAYSKDEVAKRFPDANLEEFEAYTGDMSQKEYYPDGGDYTAIQYGGREIDMLQVNYYQWWELMTYWRAENPALKIEDQEQRQQFVTIMQSMVDMRYNMSEKDDQEDLFKFKPDSEYLAMTPDQKSDMQKLCDEFGVELKAIKQNRRCYYTALITGKTILDKFKSQNQDGFTIKFKTGNYDPVRKMWYGLVRALKNPQEYANKALTEMLYTIASTSKGGVMYEQSAVDNPRRFEQQYATTRAAIQVADGAISGNKIMPKAQPALPTGYENVYAMADAAMPEAAGISKEFMGTGQGKQNSALLESQRINQVMSTLATYFDAITLYQVEHARLMLTYLRILAQNSAGRLVRVVGESGAAQYKKLSESLMAEEYDVVIGEAPITPVQKENTAKIVIELADKLATNFGQNIYAIAVGYLQGVTAQDKQKLIKVLTPDPESAQAKAEQDDAQRKADAAMARVIAEATMAKGKRDIAEAQYKMASLPKLDAETDQTRADTAKTLEETGSIAAQTNVLRTTPVSDVRVNL